MAPLVASVQTVGGGWTLRDAHLFTRQLGVGVWSSTGS